MALAAFDTLEFVETLKEAGVPEKQAKAFSAAVRKTHESSDVATKQDIADLRRDTKQDIADLRYETKQDIADLRKDLAAIEERADAKLEKLGADLRHEMHELEIGLRGDIEKLRADLRHEIHGIETGLRHEIGNLCKDMIAKHESSHKDTDVKLAEMKFDLVKWIIALGIAQAGLVISVLKFFPPHL